MEPKSSLHNPEVGRSPDIYHSEPVEREQTVSYEARAEKRPEQIASHVENEALPIHTALPVLPVPVQIQASAPADEVASSPLVANDDDLIEQEWVTKAKHIISTTKDDPYRREQEVGRLQADYLRKRYGKELGTPQ